MGSISVRRSVQWLPDEQQASEPTSTVVLTSPGRRFVDIRILLDSKPAQSALLADGPSTAYRHFGTVTMDQVDWAFAGRSESEPIPGHEGATHSKWHHLVSNRARDMSGITDEGDMFPQDDGSVLEKGRMVNPATGRDTNYEEVWVDGEPQTIPSIDPERAQLGSKSLPNRRECVVLESRDGQGINGMVICRGKLCQAVVRKAAEFGFERWAWDDTQGTWKQRARLDSKLWTPAHEVVERAARLTMGDTIHGDGEEAVWTVVELTNY